MRAIATALRRTYEDTDGNSRDSRVFGFVPMATWSVATSSLPAWMIVSSVYVYFETTATWIAASRLYARNPDVVSGTSVSDAWRTTHEPAFWRRFFSGEKCSILSVSRSPTTRSARPATIGSTSLGMSAALYWLSASVLTITSAPSFRHASRPAWKPAARPLLFVRRTMWSTPHSRATAIVRSVEPSSMTSHSTRSKPSSSRGRSASVAGSCSSSLKQGIWMMSFIGGPGRYRAVAMTRRNRLRQEGPALALLALMLAVGLFLRLHNNDYGLPYVYYADEGSHFTNRAVEMLAGDQNPVYFQNPSFFTYIVEVALRLYFGHGWI